MSWSNVGSNDTGNGHSTTATVTHAGTSGNLLLVIVACQNSTASANLTASDGTNSYHLDSVAQNSGLTVAIFSRVLTATGSATITITADQTCYFNIRAVEYSGQGTTPLDQAASGTQNSSGTTPGAGPVTTTAAGELCVGVFGNVFATYTDTPAGSWVNLVDDRSTSFSPLTIATQVQGSAGSISAGWTTSAPDYNAAVIATYKAAGASVSFTVAPATIPANHAGTITLTLAGTGTTWTTGSTVTVTNSLSGTTTVAKGTWTRTSNTAATLTVTTGAGTGTYKVTIDGVDSPTLTVGTASFALSPTSGGAGATTGVAATGANTVWTQETASTLFSWSAVAGTSISGIVVNSDTSATFNVVAGSTTGTGTVTEAPTGATRPFSIVAAKPVAVCLGDSQTYGVGLAGVPDTSPVTPGSNTYPGQLAAALGSGWAVYNAGTAGYTFAQMQAHLGTNVTPHFNAAASHNICIVMGGANNIDSASGNQTGAAAYADLQSLVAALVAGGWAVAAMPLIACNVGTGFYARRDALNALIDANWRSFAAGFGPLDLDARIGQDGDETDATYYQSDQLHPTAAGAAVIAQYAAGAVGIALEPGGSAPAGGTGVVKSGQRRRAR